jgi:hypothetical protein
MDDLIEESMRLEKVLRLTDFVRFKGGQHRAISPQPFRKGIQKVRTATRWQIRTATASRNVD